MSVRPSQTLIHGSVRRGGGWGARHIDRWVGSREVHRGSRRKQSQTKRLTFNITNWTVFIAASVAVILNSQNVGETFGETFQKYFAFISFPTKISWEIKYTPCSPIFPFLPKFRKKLQNFWRIQSLGPKLSRNFCVKYRWNFRRRNTSYGTSAAFTHWRACIVYLYEMRWRVLLGIET